MRLLTSLLLAGGLVWLLYTLVNHQKPRQGRVSPSVWTLVYGLLLPFFGLCIYLWYAMKKTPGAGILGLLVGISYGLWGLWCFCRMFTPRIRYDEDGFTVKRLRYPPEHFSYEEIVGAHRRWGGYVLIMRTAWVEVSAFASGKRQFYDFAEKKLVACSRHGSIPKRRVQNFFEVFFRGNVDDPEIVFVGYCLLLGACLLLYLLGAAEPYMNGSSVFQSMEAMLTERDTGRIFYLCFDL